MSEFLDSRPQRLCLMCGKCCRLSTAPKTYKELLELVKNDDEGAKDFLKIFEPYSSIEEARKHSPQTVDNILKTITGAGEDPNKVTFYTCRHIQDNNLCGIYKERPELCDRFPSSPWAVVPPGCGYEGWLFKKREEIKQKIRKQKELMLEFETELKTNQNPEIRKKLEEGIEKIKSMIEMFAQYGSKDW